MDMDSDDEFSPELIERLKTRIADSDWQELNEHVKMETKLGKLRDELFAKIDQLQTRMEREMAQLSVQAQADLIGQLQTYLYDLQLVEHASKKPMLSIAKILMSANPRRCVQREPNPAAKPKPPKRRKNELGGLVTNSSNSAEDLTNVRRTSAREAKLYAASQVQQQQEDRLMMELDEQGPSTSRAIGGPGRRGKRRVKEATTPVPSPTPPTTTSSRERKEEQPPHPVPSTEVEEEDQPCSSSSLHLAIPPSPLDDDCPTSSTANVSPPMRSVDSGGSQGQEGQATAMGSPLGTRATKKRGREVAGLGETVNALVAGGRSPRKKAERQGNGSGSSGTTKGDGLDEEEEAIASAAVDVDEPTYCLCEQISFGDMICCDYELCSVEWFHFACVSIKSKPKGKKWYCPLCRHNDKPNLLKPELQQKFEQIRKIQGQ